MSQLFDGGSGAWVLYSEGAAAICTWGESYYIRLVDLNSGQVTFDQPLAAGFAYTQTKPFFHTFESELLIGGLNFAEEPEGVEFFNNVQQCLANLVEPAAPAATSPPAAGTTSTATPPASRPAQPAAAPAAAAAASSKPTTPAPQPVKSNSKQNVKADAKKDEKKKEEKKKKGILGLLKGGGKKKEEEHTFVISTPTDFRHDSHIGWDPVNGFDVRWRCSGGCLAVWLTDWPLGCASADQEHSARMEETLPSSRRQEERAAGCRNGQNGHGDDLGHFG